MMPPGGGFSPWGSSFVHSVGSLVPKRTLTAVTGSNRIGVCCRLGLCRLPERRRVVQNPKPTTVGAGHQVGTHTGAVVLHLDVPDGNRRHVQAQGMPVVTVVEGHPDLGFRGGIQEPRLSRVFPDGVGHGTGGYAVVDLRPCLAAVVGAPEVGVHVVDAHGVGGGVGGALVEMPGFDVEDPRPGRDLRRGHVGPVRAAVRGDLDVAVVGAGPEDAHVEGRGGQGGDDCPDGYGVTWSAYLPALAGTSQVGRDRSGLIRVQLLPRSRVCHTALEV